MLSPRLWPDLAPSYYVELEQNRRDNSDDRYQYNNSAIMLGAKWEF